MRQRSAEQRPEDRQAVRGLFRSRLLARLTGVDRLARAASRSSFEQDGGELLPHSAPHAGEHAEEHMRLPLIVNMAAGPSALTSSWSGRRARSASFIRRHRRLAADGFLSEADHIDSVERRLRRGFRRVAAPVHSAVPDLNIEVFFTFFLLPLRPRAFAVISRFFGPGRRRDAAAAISASVPSP